MLLVSHDVLVLERLEDFDLASKLDLERACTCGTRPAGSLQSPPRVQHGVVVLLSEQLDGVLHPFRPVQSDLDRRIRSYPEHLLGKIVYSGQAASCQRRRFLPLNVPDAEDEASAALVECPSRLRLARTGTYCHYEVCRAARVLRSNCQT